MPDKYTCQGPPLAWDQPPAGTQSLALIMEDLDAPVEAFTHWVISNIPANMRGFPEDIGPKVFSQGKNDFGATGYGGPCPPQGPAHRYQFTVYALDSLLELKAGITKEQLLTAMEGRILAQGWLTGIYQR